MRINGVLRIATIAMFMLAPFVVQELERYPPSRHIVGCVTGMVPAIATIIAVIALLISVSWLAIRFLPYIDRERPD